MIIYLSKLCSEKIFFIPDPGICITNLIVKKKTFKETLCCQYTSQIASQRPTTKRRLAHSFVTHGPSTEIYDLGIRLI